MPQNRHVIILPVVVHGHFWADWGTGRLFSLILEHRVP